MVKKSAIPDAWDDDWEAQADKAEEIATVQTPGVEQPPAKITKAERLAKHAESNKKLWDSAESPEPFHFLAARDTIPLKQEFKPALKVLSRKPAPKVIAKQDPITGLQKLTLEDEEDDDEDEGKKPSPEELRVKAQKEREEKKKRYDEARAKIFGTGEGSVSGSGRSSPAGGKKAKGKGEKIMREGSRPGSSGSGDSPEILHDEGPIMLIEGFVLTNGQGHHPIQWSNLFTENKVQIVDTTTSGILLKVGAGGGNSILSTAGHC